MKIRGSQPQAVAVGKDGIWFTDAGTGKIGFIILPGKATEYATPMPRYDSLSVIALAPNGVLWFQEIGDVGGGNWPSHPPRLASQL
jgi:streptogramin lyase